ncbi:MAG: hypothetical protein HPM95_03335 [Alphaproteobacteria bacterium]|nr:hypothetical protein [Alphaproteobacteria bacterium]
MMLAMMGFIFNDSFVKLVSENLPLGQIMFLRRVFAPRLPAGDLRRHGLIRRFRCC